MHLLIRLLWSYMYLKLVISNIIYILDTHILNIISII